MIKTKLTRMVMVTSTLLWAATVLAAGAKPARAAAPATKSAPAAVKAGPLAAIIEAAKQERTVSAGFTAGYDRPSAVKQLKEAIKNKYGLDLDIKVQATSGMAAMIAKAIMETKTGAEPSFDLVMFSSDYVPRATQEGIVEMVDWRSIFEPGTPREAQYNHPMLKAGVVVSGSTIGLQYNPQKVSAQDAPKKLADLANPKWKGRLGIHDYASHWARLAYILGKTETLTTLRAILKNKPVLDHFPPLNNRYLSGEIDMAYTVDHYVALNRARGKPTEWRSMDRLEIRDYEVVLMKGSKRPNAAKLVAVFLASSEGAKYVMEAVERHHHLYPGNPLYDAIQAAKKEGIQTVTWESLPGLLDFIQSKEYRDWEKEVQVILDTAGK